MKYIKIYKSKYDPEIGEFAITEPDPLRFGLSDYWREFVKYNIGKIVGISDDIPYKERKYKIEYNDEMSKQILWFLKKEIIAHSKNMEDLDYIIKANKYNL